MTPKISKFEQTKNFVKTNPLFFSFISILISLVSLGVAYTFFTPNKLQHKITCQTLKEREIELMRLLKKTKSYGDSINYLSKRQYLDTIKRDLKCNE